MIIEEVDKKSLNKAYILHCEKSKLICRMSDFNNEFECKVLKLFKNKINNVPRLVAAGRIDNGKFLPFYGDIQEFSECLPKEKKYYSILEYIEGDCIKSIDLDDVIKLAQILQDVHFVRHELYDQDYFTKENCERLKFYLDNINTVVDADTYHYFLRVYDKVSQIEFD